MSNQRRQTYFIASAFLAVGLSLSYLFVAIIRGVHRQAPATPALTTEAPRPADPVIVTVRTPGRTAIAVVSPEGHLESASFMGDNGLARGDFTWAFRYSWEEAKDRPKYAVTLENYVQHYRPLECIAKRDFLIAAWDRPEVQRAYERVQHARAEHEWWYMHAVYLDERDMEWNIDVQVNRSQEAVAAMFTASEAEERILEEGRKLAVILGVLPEYEKWQEVAAAGTDPCKGGE